MSPDDTDLALAEIFTRWHSLLHTGRPEGMWVARHQPMSGVCDRITTDVDAAWYFDGSVFHPKQPMDFVRFIAVRSGAFWHSGREPAPQSAFHGDRHDIGVAHFTEDLERSQLYIEVIFGGRHAAGVLYSRTPVGLHAESTVWLS
jgi:hypothetical protein